MTIAIAKVEIKEIDWLSRAFEVKLKLFRIDLTKFFAKQIVIIDPKSVGKSSSFLKIVFLQVFYP